MSDTTPAEATEQQAPQEPALRVVRGEPTPEELAALVLVVAAASGGDAAEPEPQGTWAHRGRGLGVRPLAHRDRNRAWSWRSGAR